MEKSWLWGETLEEMYELKWQRRALQMEGGT